MKWKRQICNHGAPLEWCNYCLNEQRKTPARRPVINMSTESTTGNTTGSMPTAATTPTYGQKAVGLSFNPSGDDAVANCKQGFAKLIDQMNDFRTNSTSNEQKRLASVAITEAQGAQMWAVKALTWKD